MCTDIVIMFMLTRGAVPITGIQYKGSCQAAER